MQVADERLWEAHAGPRSGPVGLSSESTNGENSRLGVGRRTRDGSVMWSTNVRGVPPAVAQPKG